MHSFVFLTGRILLKWFVVAAKALPMVITLDHLPLSLIIFILLCSYHWFNACTYHPFHAIPL